MPNKNGLNNPNSINYGIPNSYLLSKFYRERPKFNEIKNDSNKLKYWGYDKDGKNLKTKRINIGWFKQMMKD